MTDQQIREATKNMSPDGAGKFMENLQKTERFWEERRWQAAVAAMQGMLSNTTNAGSCEEFALDAVDNADALIAKFRKTEATT